MGDKAQGIHRLAVEFHVHLYKFAGAVSGELIIQGGIALGVGLERVKEVVDDLVEGHLVVKLHQVCVQVLHILELTPAVLAHGHNVAHELVGRDDIYLHIGFLRPLNRGGVGIVMGVIHRHHRAVGLIDMIDHGGQGGHKVQVKLPFQPFLDDLHVEHPQKAAPEAKAQGHGALRLKAQGGVVELELFQRVPEIRILGAVLRVDAAVDHGLDRPVARQGLRRGGGGVGDGVAHPGVLHIFNTGGEIAHFAGAQTLTGLHAKRQQMAALHHLVDRAGGHHLHLLARPDAALHQPHVDNDTPVAVILAVKDQRFERRLRIACGRGYVFHDVLQHGVDVDPHLGGDLRCVQGGQADDILHLLLGPGGVRRRKVDLVEHRQNFQVVFHGKVRVGQSLGLHALGGVHHQHRALAGCQGPGHLIVEVHMARGIDEVQLIVLPVLGTVGQPDSPSLDGDAPLPLQIHIVQQLVRHLPLCHCPAGLQQPVRQRGLAMVDVGNDRKISDILLFCHICINLLGQVRTPVRLRVQAFWRSHPPAAGQTSSSEDGN